MTSPPRVLDVRDDLRRAQSASDHDVDEDVSEVVSALDRYADPDRRHRQSLLDTAENTLLRLQEQETSEEAARRFQAARNRIEIFRNAIPDTDTDLVVVGSEMRGPSAESDREDERVREDPAEVHVSVANLGEAVESLVEVSFYDEDGTVLDGTATTVALDADGEETVTLDVDVPADAAYHVAVAREDRA